MPEGVAGSWEGDDEVCWCEGCGFVDCGGGGRLGKTADRFMSEEGPEVDEGACVGGVD